MPHPPVQPIVTFYQAALAAAQNTHPNPNPNPYPYPLNPDP